MEQLQCNQTSNFADSVVLLAARKKSVWDFDNLDENGNPTLKKLECKSNACNNRSHCFFVAFGGGGGAKRMVFGCCDFSIIFNYGYGAVSVDFGGGSDKIVFPYG